MTNDHRRPNDDLVEPLFGGLSQADGAADRGRGRDAQEAGDQQVDVEPSSWLLTAFGISLLALAMLVFILLVI